MKGIYIIRHPEGGVYIGQSSDLQRRTRRHLTTLYSYGCVDHTVSICHELPVDVSQSVLDEYERFYIERYREVGLPVFNLMGGGIVSMKLPDTARKTVDNWQVGRRLSKEHRANIAKAGVGRKHSYDTKIKIGESNYGKVVSDVAKAKMSLAKKGKPLSEEHKKKLSAALLGRVISDETKLKMSAWQGKVVRQFRTDGSFVKEWESATKAHNALNISRGDICSCARGVLKTAGGYVWKYKNNES